jgi:catalase
MFSYPDAARYRLGANYQQLPPNKPLSSVYSPYQRDGPGTINGNYGGDPDYVRSGFRRINFRNTHCYPEGHEVWNGKMQSYATEVTDRDFVQPRELWEIIKREKAEGQFLENIVPTLVPVEKGLSDKAIGEFSLLWFWKVTDV